MGQSTIAASGTDHTSSNRRSKPTSAMSPPITGHRDYSSDIPDECLALIFQLLGSGDRKQCSLVCRRWHSVDGQSRHRLSLDARAALVAAAPAIFDRFDSVTKLALKCDRRADSIGDDALGLISGRCPNLTRLKLRACREITGAGMSALAKNCPSLKKLSCGSCTFGAKGIDSVLRGCPLLEDISIKRLRGLTDAAGEQIGPGVAASSLRSVCLKELYNGQCFGPLIAGSPNLRTLKLFRCSGDWDRLLIEIAEKAPKIVEIHLEKLQVTDHGLYALSACSDLEVLHLVKTPECTDIGLAAVAERCRLLRKLHIDGWKTNRIGDEGLMAVARRCPNLQELVLIGVNPTVLSLALIVSNCKNLERLALCGSETFGDAEISCIASKCVSLKKLCIKGCPVSDQGMEAIAEGCPNLVKIKVKKCRGVTPEGADWLRACRETLAVNLDTIAPIKIQDAASMSENGIENGVGDQIAGLVEQIAAIDLPSSSNGRPSQWRNRIGFMSGRNFFTNFRRWGSGGAGGGGGSSNLHHM
ncbi:F-box protein-like [Iris pallida]|uniref:F-box protein-like n=1 Tax=Iris pallida TaxID=29817 RepID=A0AAX6FWG4_IRIPA|nr:F-box protein-like [Iris pallida]KAJ6820710.1 F-box protein-like [Iris pallida]